MHITRIVIGSEDQLQKIASMHRTQDAKKRARRSSICMLHLTRAQVRRLNRQTQGAFNEMLGRTTTPLNRYDQGFRRRNLPDEQMISVLQKAVNAMQDRPLEGLIIQLVMGTRNAGRNTHLFVR